MGPNTMGGGGDLIDTRAKRTKEKEQKSGNRDENRHSPVPMCYTNALRRIKIYRVMVWVCFRRDNDLSPPYYSFLGILKRITQQRNTGYGGE